MEKKKIKMWKKILIIILLILLIFISIVARKIIILSSLDNKISQYQIKENIYSKITINKETIRVNNGTEEIYVSETFEKYIKDGIVKEIMESKKIDNSINKITQITYPNERKNFFENGTSKEMKSYKEDNNDFFNHKSNIIVNFAETSTLSEKLFNSITSKIKTVEIDGKKY